MIQSYNKKTILQELLELLIYKNHSKEYTPNRIDMLLGWHEKEPVSKYELHRNAEIFKVQGNRNPLIDHPEWTGKIDFTLGLG